MKNWLKMIFACFLILCFQTVGSAEWDLTEIQAHDFFAHYSTDDLLLIRELIDAELESRAYAAENVHMYVLNANTLKFHVPDCSSVNKMEEKNKKSFVGDKAEVLFFGYSPCENCNP